MKKSLIIGIVVLLIVALVVPMAFAGGNSILGSGANRANCQNINAADLTDAQKAELNTLHDQMFELRKQMVQKYVDFGAITQDQANTMIQNMTERHEAREKNGFGPGMGMGRGGKGQGQSRGNGQFGCLQTNTPQN